MRMSSTEEAQFNNLVNMTLKKWNRIRPKYRRTGLVCPLYHKDHGVLMTCLCGAAYKPDPNTLEGTLAKKEFEAMHFQIDHLMMINYKLDKLELKEQQRAN